jgi:hypothetical protein
MFANANCSGEFTIASIAGSDGFDSCEEDGDQSFQFSIEGNKLQQTMFEGPSCDTSYPYTQIEFALGTCISFGSSARSAKKGNSLFGKREDFASSALMGTIILAGVNDSYTAPQERTTPNPAYQPPQAVNYDCYSANNCTFEGVPAANWVTEYQDVNCTNPDYSYAQGNFTLGTCYRTPHNSYGVSYVRLDCAGEHAVTSRFFYGDGCQSEFLSMTSVSSCGPHSTQSTYCTLPPPSDPTPPSTATSIRSSLVALLIVTLLAFLSL